MTALGTLALGLGRDIKHAMIKLAAEGRGRNTYLGQGTLRAPHHDPELRNHTCEKAKARPGHSSGNGQLAPPKAWCLV